MATNGHVHLPRLFSGRAVLAYAAWSLAVVAVFFITTSHKGVVDAWLWGSHSLFVLFCWLSGMLVIASAVLFFMHDTFTQDLRSKKQSTIASDLCDKSEESKILVKEQMSCDMLNRIGVGYFSLDSHWQLRNMNDRFAAMRGLTLRTDAFGKLLFDLLEEEDIPKAKDCTLRLADGDPVSEIFSRRLHDGKLLHHMVVLSPLRHDGGLLGAEGIMIDVTDHRVVEDRIRRHLAELAQVQRVNSMGKMVTELAHEIAQPLYAITNYAEACSHVVQSGQPLKTDMLLHWMNQVAEQANRAADVIRRLRGFIHKSKSERVEVDLNNRIENVIHLMGPGAREHGVDIEFHRAEELPCVLADPIQIDQVLVNLIQNAIEAMHETPSRERRIMIETLHDDGHMIRTAVRDMGQGIGEHNVNRIFDAFYSTKENGMGIGLAICRSIMLDHGGRLWPTHNLHRGTTFHFSLPMAIRG